MRVKIFGVGNTGGAVLELLIQQGIGRENSVAINTDPQALSTSSAAEKLHLETPLMRGLGCGGDPDRGRELAEAQAPRLKELCAETDLALVLAGLGGGAGTGISPVVARLARESGALTVGFASTPFDCEGGRRRQLAAEGMEGLKAAADGVITLPNQKVFKLIDENTGVLETFRITNNLMCEGVMGVLRLFNSRRLIEIPFSEVCALLRDRHTESSFATVEACGQLRSSEVVDKLLAHPLLEGGRGLAESESVLVSITGGPGLTMAEINRIMEQMNQQCGSSQVIMGAAVDESFSERLSLSVIVVQKKEAPTQVEPRFSTGSDGLSGDFLNGKTLQRSPSKFVPPPPELSPEKMKQLAGQRPGSNRARKASPRFRQGDLPLDIISKGRFEKSEPTIHKGEDLDVPTYVRRGISLN
jgi:cell division protein FtsZ